MVITKGKKDRIPQEFILHWLAAVLNGRKQMFYSLNSRPQGEDHEAGRAVPLGVGGL